MARPVRQTIIPRSGARRFGGAYVTMDGIPVWRRAVSAFMEVVFHREYLARLPLALAQLYSRSFNAKDARGRHDNAFYLCEALVKLAAAPLAACYVEDVHKGQPRVPELDRLLARLALPSLGQWLAILRTLA